MSECTCKGLPVALSHCPTHGVLPEPLDTHPSDPDLRVEDGRLRWHMPDTPPEKEAKNYIRFEGTTFVWVRPVRPGLAVLAAYDGVYIGRWHVGHFEDTFTVSKVYAL